MIKFSTAFKLIALSGVLILAGCQSKPKETADNAPPMASEPTTSAPTSSIVPGSAEDLRVNVGDTVHFDYDRYDIMDSDRAVLQRQAAWLGKYPVGTCHGRRALRRARHARIQSCAGRAQSECREGVSCQSWRLRRPARDDLLRQGAADVHGVERILLGTEPPRGYDHHERRELLRGERTQWRGRLRWRPFSVVVGCSQRPNFG